jgi:hypothetical protein
MRSLTLLTILPATLALAACGSSSSSSSGSGSGAASKTASALAFARCMRTHGVPNFPDPQTSGGGLNLRAQREAGQSSLTVNGVSVNAPAFRSAQRACQSLLPNGGHPRPLSASQRQALLRFAQCMRTHGVPGFPDPTFLAGGGVGINFSDRSGLDPNSPAFRNAQKACQSITGNGAFSFKAGP